MTPGDRYIPKPEADSPFPPSLIVQIGEVDGDWLQYSFATVGGHPVATPVPFPMKRDEFLSLYAPSPN